MAGVLCLFVFLAKQLLGKSTHEKKYLGKIKRENKKIKKGQKQTKN